LALPDERRAAVGFFDRLFGRGKQAAGDVTGDESLPSEGVHQEMKGEAEDRADEAEEAAQEAREEAAAHEVQKDAEADN
jgi:uncharacterized protein YjbJ (UPF0337 family)